MRAKEYLQINKNKILYYDIVKSAIDDLSLLRNKKCKTEEYFNKYLFSDARYLVQKEKFIHREGEVDRNYAFDVRMYILNAVCNDQSFIFTYNIIVMQINDYHELTPYKFCKIKEINCDTISNIESICSKYKDDYPKSNLIGYLLDDDNNIFYDKKQLELYKGEKWWLNVFNEAYAIFDKMRMNLNKPFDAKCLITEYENEDKDFENTVVELVRCLVSGYDYDLCKEQKKSIVLLSKIIDLHFSQVKRQSPMERIKNLENLLNEREEEYQRRIETKENIIESLNLEIQSLNHEIESQNRDIESKNRKIAQYKKDLLYKGLTISQQNIFYYYIFNELGVNFENTIKKDWAKLISTISGKNEENIRKALSFNFDDTSTKNDMIVVAKVVYDLFPNISQKMLNDCE